MRIILFAFISFLIMGCAKSSMESVSLAEKEKLEKERSATIEAHNQIRQFSPMRVRQ